MAGDGSAPRGGRRILLICADQLRPDALGCYGNNIVETPNIDRLAGRGRRFENHFTAAAPCGPSRTTLLTGLYPQTHRAIGNRTPFDGSTPNVATALAAVGVPSHLVGYTDTVHPPYLGDAEGVMPGFSVHTHFNLSEAGLRSWVRTLEKLGYGPFPSASEVFRHRIQSDGAVPPHRRRSFYATDESDTAYVADRAIDCIREHRDEPWLIHVSFLRPHPPWTVPEPFHGRYAPSKLAGGVRAASWAEEAAKHPFLQYWLERSQQRVFADGEGWAGVLPDVALADARSAYLGLVAELDHHLGRILGSLDEMGLAHETLVVFTADHGDMLGDHWTFGTGGYFDAAYRIPLIVYDPSRGPAPDRGAERRFTESVDVVPTLLQWAGAPPLDWSDGLSLLPLVHGASTEWPRHGAFFEFDFRDPLHGEAERALDLASEDCVLNVWRTSRYKFVHFNALPPLLFDLVDDPDELAPGAVGAEYQAVVVQSLGTLLSHRIRHTDQAVANTAVTGEVVSRPSPWSMLRRGGRL